MVELVASLETEYQRNRDQLLCEDGSIRSPLLVLREVARDYTTPVHLEFHEVLISNTEKAYQVEMYVGRLRGRGEAPRRKLAMQIAAADVLGKIKNQRAFEIPLYGLIPGTLIPPTIFMDLVALTQTLGLPSPFYVHIPDDPEVEPENLFTYKCQIGQLINFGKSDSRFVAKRLAAKETYAALTGEEYPLDEVNFGARCDLLERFKIVPQNSQKKIEIMKYREQCRKNEAQMASSAPVASTSSAADAKEEEDDFGEPEEAVPSTNPDEAEGVAERMRKLNLPDIRARLTNLSLEEQEIKKEVEEF